MRILPLSSLVIVGHLKGCDPTMQPPSVFMTEKCEIPQVTTGDGDVLSRETQESIVITNESIATVCGS